MEFSSYRKVTEGKGPAQCTHQTLDEDLQCLIWAALRVFVFVRLISYVLVGELVYDLHDIDDNICVLVAQQADEERDGAGAHELRIREHGSLRER